jgi:hypothetical protein
MDQDRNTSFKKVQFVESNRDSEHQEIDESTT